MLQTALTMHEEVEDSVELIGRTGAGMEVDSERGFLSESELMLRCELP